MRFPKRDIVATALVALALVLYILWVLDATFPVLSDTRATGLVVLALGFAASASAVVPGFERLMHGNRAYLVLTSVLGLAAFGGGVAMLVWGSATGLAVVIGAMVVLWAISTTHHVLLAQDQPGAASAGTPGAGREHHASTR